MKVVAILLSCLILVNESMCQIPNVYEFCTSLLSDNEHAGCGACQQGRGGKRGPEGRQGPIGIKGEKGNEGTCNNLEKEIALVKDKNDALLNIMFGRDSQRFVEFCGLGMKNRKIPDSALTASNQYSSTYAASAGRLDQGSRTNYVWVVLHSEDRIGHWIQVDFGKPTDISGVITQGRPLNNQWVKTFKIFCGDLADDLAPVMENGSEKIFDGNTDRDSYVITKFATKLTCRFIRLYPMSWNSHISMRMEILKGDCYELY